MRSTNILIIIGVIFLCISLLIIGCGPEWILLNRMSSFKEPKDLGPVGDSFGGSLGPLVALLGAAITFLAFWVQYRANEIQKDAINKQNKTVEKQEIDLARERFESKFYKQLEILKSNTSEIKIGKTTDGRKSFVALFNELKFIYHLLNNHYNKVHYPNFKEEISQEAIYNISYLIFFFGIGSNSSLLVRSFLNGKLLRFFENASTVVEINQALWREEQISKNPIAVETDDGHFTLNIKFRPGNGHVSDLSHYIRHLFQTVKFVDSAKEEVITKDMKYDYISILRSQLSPYEQIFIFYNAISILGKPWVDSPNYLKRYCLIKSSLLPLCDFYKTPSEVLGEYNEDGKPLFEWREISKRLEAL